MTTSSTGLLAALAGAHTEVVDMAGIIVRVDSDIELDDDVLRLPALRKICDAMILGALLHACARTEARFSISVDDGWLRIGARYTLSPWVDFAREEDWFVACRLLCVELDGAFSLESVGGWDRRIEILVRTRDAGAPHPEAVVDMALGG